MTRKLLINFYLFSLVRLCSCTPGEPNHATAAEGEKPQVDSVKFIQAALSYIEGKQLFSRLCSACHGAPEIDMTDQYLFDKIFERLPAPSEDYFVSYISDSWALKATGNKYARRLDTIYNNDYEHQFKDSLSKHNFSNLITYIKIAAKQRYQGKRG